MKGFQKHGYGKITSIDGWTIEGEFYENRYHGDITITAPGLFYKIIK